MEEILKYMNTKTNKIVNISTDERDADLMKLVMHNPIFERVEEQKLTPRKPVKEMI